MENSTQLAAMSVREFIELLASNAPAPGGGSASAVAGWPQWRQASRLENPSTLSTTRL